MPRLELFRKRGGAEIGSALKDSCCGERGFTLVEILVVVANLGILVAVVTPNVGKFIGEGKSEAMEPEMHVVKLAMDSRMLDNNVKAITES